MCSRKFGALECSVPIADTTDPTKKLAFDVSGVSTETTRTFIVPNVNGTLGTIGSIVTATADSTTSSSVYTLLNSMTITPGAGTYICIFSASANVSSGGRTATYAIFNNGTIVSHSTRSFSPGTASEDYSLSTQAIETVSDSQAIEVRETGSGLGDLVVHQRSLMLIKQ